MKVSKSVNVAFATIFYLVSTAIAIDSINYAAYAPSATFTVAQELGFFSHHNISVMFHQIASEVSTHSESLFSRYDVMSVTMDEALDITLNHELPIFVLGQMDAGPELVFAASAGVESFNEMRGQTVLIDGHETGYAYATQIIMEHNGLTDSDYVTKVVPETADRYSLLMSTNATYATILSYPFTSLLVSDDNLTSLTTVANYIAPYSHMTLITTNLTNITPAWPNTTSENSTKPSPLTRFYTSLLAANAYLSVPSSQLITTTAIGRYLNTTASLALSAYNAALNNITGEIGGGGSGNFMVDTRGLNAVVSMRNQSGGFAQLLEREPEFDFDLFVQEGGSGVVSYEIRDEALKGLDGWEPFLG